MPEPQVAIIADDLTGASDSAIYFAQAGLTTLVSLEPERHPSADVLAVTTHSRHLSEEEAAGLTGRVANQIRRTRGAHPTALTYNKIDSTLRGHPGASLAAVMANLGADRALVAPAFPGQGRTTVGGQQMVNGQPLARTPFGREVGTSSVVAVLQRFIPEEQVQLIDSDTVCAGVDAISRALEARSPAVFVADATSEADLVLLAQAAIGQGIRLLCGSAGLARALGDVVPLVPNVPAPRLPSTGGGTILAVAGSRHPGTAAQVDAACQAGVLTMCPEEDLLGTPGEASAFRVVQAVVRQLSEARDLILTTVGLAPSPHSGQLVANKLGQITKGVLACGQVGGLVLTGGDVAMSVCSALGCTTLWLCGEVEPGVPWGKLVDGAQPGLPVVTKAGGFGGQQALVKAIRHLHAVSGSMLSLSVE
jgi:uncharacterized protein YgbK (DUF1537 family)